VAFIPLVIIQAELPLAVGRQVAVDDGPPSGVIASTASLLLSTISRLGVSAW
jgi:hypothetical protein